MRGPIRRLLAVPAAYRLVTFALGGEASRLRFAREHIRAEDGQSILDIGCGPADILAVLPRVRYTGFDLNPDYIETAKRNYGDRGSFYCQTVNDESLEKHSGFDIVLAIGLVHHLDDAEANRLFSMARAALKPGGRLVTYDGGYVEGQSRIARYIVSRDRGEYVREVAAYTKLAEAVFPKVQTLVRHDLLRVPYTHVILECER